MSEWKYGLRLLRSQPSYALLVIVTIALGIGATTTLFSVANSVLLTPLPWPDANRPVQLTESRGGRQGRIPGTILNGTFLAWGEAPQTVEALAAWRTATITLNTGGNAERLEIASVSPNMFDMLRARPVIGRTFAPNEASGPLQPTVAILSYGLWQERFGGRDDVLGSAVQLDGSSVTIVGVMPREFGFPDSRIRAWTAWAIPTVDDGRGNRLQTAAVLHALLPSILPAEFPRADAIAIDGTVLMVALALTIIASLTCGLLPLIHVRRLDLTRSLSEGGMASVGAGRSRLAVTGALIVSSQVAVTCVLLVGATLLARSFLAQMNADRGYDPSNLLTAALPFPRAYSVERKAQTLDAILERVKSRPGVTHAAFGAALPLVSAGGFVTFKFQSPFGGREIEAESIRRIVSPGYFGALGLRVAAGRPLTDADDASVPAAVVVNRSFVRNYLDDVPIERAVSQSLGLNAIQCSATRVS